jgi:hypothetical protein
MKTGRIFKTGQVSKTGRILAVWLFAVTALLAGAWAQDSTQDQAPQVTQNYPAGPNGEQEPQSERQTDSRSEGPAPAVARISLIFGDVSTQRGDTGDWSVTSINAPVVRGDQVATGDKSRTEVQLDYANIIRLAAHSQIKIADLTRSRIQIQVAQGYANYTMAKGGEADVEIDSPNVAVRPLKAGRYRVQVGSDSETDVIVREGEAEITTPQGSTRVREGELITIRGTENPEYKISAAPDKDDWDRWNRDRDNVIREADGPRKTNRYYTGASDLDGYGRWVYVPGYGNVWQPYQQAAWAPYQTGRWVWEPYYGWTWVSYEPWGWAPYHYGRWFYYGNNWCWWPGPAYVGYRPLWSPAFVFFVGFGHRSGFGFGSIGWFPVGPHDAFYPWYGRGFNRVNVVNITNINVVNVNRGGGYIAPLAVRGRQPYYSNANLALTNPRVRGSITSVSAADFGRGGNAGWRHGVEEHELRDSHVMTANLPVVPSRESLHAGSGAIPAGVRTRDNERFFTRHQPPAAPESFHDQMQRVQRVVGPEAAGASSSGNQGNVRTDMHGGPGQVDRRDVNGGINPGGHVSGGVNVKTGSVEVPRVGGSTGGGPSNGGSAGGSNGPLSPKDSPGRMSDSVTAERSGQGNSGTPAAGGNAAQDSRHGDRGGWTRFGPPTEHSNGGAVESAQTSTPTPRSNDQGRAPRTDSTAEPRKGGDSPNWQKFPTTGERPSTDRQANDRQINDRQINDRQTNDRQINDRQGADHSAPSSDRGGAQTPVRTQDDRSGGWQRFPQNSDRGVKPSDVPATRNDRTDPSGGSKPPLELHRPIVTPRQPEIRNDQRTPPPTRTPDVRNEPRYSPPPQRSEPRYSPPARTQSHESHSNSSSSHGGSSDRGSHNDSKSSSNPKQR